MERRNDNDNNTTTNNIAVEEISKLYSYCCN